MASKPISLLGHNHVCPAIDPGPVPHVGGPIITAQANIRVNGIPVAVKGDQCICTGCGKTDTITQGSANVRINGKPIARIGDACAHGGKLVQGHGAVKVH
jgi:uncharacterized Zn-binding protein involved in type VI secretion